MSWASPASSRSTRRVTVPKSLRSRALAASFLLLRGALPVPAQDAASVISADVQRVFDRVKGAVVRVEAEDTHGRLSGTGFFIDPQGTIYTAYSVGGEAEEITVEFGNNRYPAHQVVTDVRSGIAILKVEASTPWITVGDSSALKTASPVITVGYPLDLPVTPDFGMVGGFDLKHHDRFFSTTLVRANVPAQRGEAGAPVLNMAGEAVAIVLSAVDRNACWALPIKAAEKVRMNYVQFGDLHPGWLGINVVPGDEPASSSVVAISGFADESPAAAAGLKSGDVLLQVGSVKIKEPSDVIDASFFLTADEDVPVTIARGSQVITLKVTAAEPPAYQRQRFPLFAPGSPAVGQRLPSQRDD